MKGSTKEERRRGETEERDTIDERQKQRNMRGKVEGQRNKGRDRGT